MRKPKPLQTRIIRARNLRLRPSFITQLETLHLVSFRLVSSLSISPLITSPYSSSSRLESSHLSSLSPLSSPRSILVMTSFYSHLISFPLVLRLEPLTDVSLLPTPGSTNVPRLSYFGTSFYRLLFILKYTNNQYFTVLTL